MLLVRTSALGDVVHCLPVLGELARQWPQARLAWVVEEAFAPLLAGQPPLAEVIPVRLRVWRHRPLSRDTRRELAAAVARLRAFRPDLALDLMGNHKAGLLALASGAPRRLGPRRRDRVEPSSAIWLSETAPVAGDHAVDRALSLLPALGLDLPDTPDFGAEHLGAGVASDGGPAATGFPPGYVLVQAGASWGNKRYPAAWWGEVAATVRAATGREVLVLAGPGEEELAAEVAAGSGGAARALPAAGLAGLVSLLRGCDLLLSGDTGPLHLAHALGTPVLAVMGPTDPARHGPYRAPERALAVRLPCSFCYRRYTEPKACLLDIHPARVAAAALAALGAPPPVTTRLPGGAPASR